MTVDEKALASYRQSLMIALRMKDVPGDRIGEIIAEVESHVADTDEDPVEAFGPPKDYATTLTAGHRRESWCKLAFTGLSAGIAGWLVAQGALSLLTGTRSWGQPGWLWLAIGLVIGIPTTIAVQRSSSQVRDPRTGADMVPMSRWAMALLVGVPILLIVAAWAVIELADFG